MIKYKNVTSETDEYGNTRHYYRTPGTGRRIRLPDPKNRTLFSTAVKNAAQGHDVSDLVGKCKNSKTHLQRKKINYWRTSKALVIKARHRAKTKNIECDIDEEWVFEQISASKYKCPMSGIPYNTENPTDSHMNPFSPSLDRIETKQGYTKKNVRVISFIVNSMMSDWGKDLMLNVCQNIIKLDKGEDILFPHPEFGEGQ